MLQFQLPPTWLSFLLISVIEFLLIVLLLKSKRLKNGMPYLIEKGSNDFGVYISATLLFSASILGLNKNAELIYIIPLFFLLICVFFIFFWWRGSIARKYRDKLKAQEIAELHQALKAKNQENEQLCQQNDAQAKIIHKDNKLIPALDYAVRQYLLTAENEPDSAVRLSKAKSLLAQVEAASQERRGILTSFQPSKKLPSTDIPSVDALLANMAHRAQEQGVTFDVTVTGSVKYLIDNLASEQDVNTLLADLIENAIIAVRTSANKNVMVHIGIAENIYAIDVFDSGDPFAPETVAEVGIHKTTTHAEEGGSGIGLMTTFEILKKNEASFVIEDLVGNTQFTKKVSACFDGQSQFRFLAAEDVRLQSLSSRGVCR
ncbi:GHKL domain-containing protein [Oscillospiraceae bacterium WX1]